jgi:uncharacterized membrane protein SpoIIM required for sporulation
MALLYRQASADLSVVRDDPSAAGIARRLNDLLGRAHNLIYSGQRPRARGIRHFYARGFPSVFRQNRWFVVAALVIFLAGGAAGAAMSTTDPGFRRLILGGAMLDTIERREMWTHSLVALKPLASSAIMTNNLTVALATFASGVFAGAGTVYLLLFNGLMLGVVFAACHQAGMGASLWSFVAAHGALEIPALLIAGGAGLRFGSGLLAPGTLPRRQALTEAAHASVRLMFGVLPLLVVAGVIEAFVSPTDIRMAVKFGIGGTLLCLLAAYLVATPDAVTEDSAT